MQKNCTEFVAYEDILGSTGRGRQAGVRTRAVTDIADAMPLIRRALKLLADREVTPQLGLLKSTLLQLDSSFSERAYGASSFRDFVEKLAKAGHVALKGADRSFQVELREPGDAAAAAPMAPAPSAGTEPAEPRERRDHRAPRLARGGRERDGRQGHPSEVVTRDPVEAAAAPVASAPLGAEAALAEDVPRLGPADGYRIMVQAFSRSGATPRFPMYVRQFKHFLKTFDENFDERRYGFAGIVDALRFGQREGLFRLDRDRQGGVRVHPGAQYLMLTKSPEAAPVADVLATGESPQGGLPPLDGEAVPVQDTGLAPDRPQTTPELLPFEAEGIPAPRDAKEASPAVTSEVATTEGAGSPAESATVPRRTGRKRTGAGTATREKKTAPPTSGAKTKKKTTPRARKKTS
jgi:hypothetical protein